jgi:hypothetical protein
LLGTNAANSLTALVWNPGVSQADVATINALIKDDVNATHPLSGGFIREGLLYVPNRGGAPLQLRPGDVVALDATSGQIILLTAYGLSAGPWTLA